MKPARLVFFASILSFSMLTGAHGAELAQWQFPNNATPVLISKEGRELPIELAIVNSDTWLVSLLDLRKPGVSGSTCYDGQQSDKIEEGAPLKINGKFVKFKYVCMGKVGVMQPSTDQGKAYLNKLALSGKEIQIIFSESQTLNFPASDVEAMKRKVAEAKNAM
ncbi:hypothetical protein [Pantoea agglomerans]|uniref:hypothetical protein n=1 Tax=Enterobacter agglomerans TaxID=549 RepID=UPI002F92568C